MKKNLLKLFAVVLAVSLALFSLSLTVGATGDALQITVEQVESYAGDSVDIKVSITDNPGIASLTLAVSYGNGLELVSVDNGAILKGFVSEPANYGSPYTLAWANDLATANVTATGTLATLHFAVASDATGTQAITVACDTANDGALDKDLNSVAVTVTDGGINVSDELVYVAGGKCAEDSTLRWGLYQGGIIRITGKGAMPNYKKTGANAAPWMAGYSADITKVIVEDGVTAIGTLAFHHLPALTDVEMADTVTVINSSAFYGCSVLKNVQFSSKLNKIDYFAFYNCKSIDNLTLPASLTTISNSAFAFCRGLESVTMEGGVKTIGNSTFDTCTSLKKVIFADTVTSIGSYAFRGCTALQTVVFNEGLTDIGEYAFYNCINLKNVILPDSIDTVGASAFTHSNSASANSLFVVIPSGFASMGKNAFADVASLSNVYFNGTTEQKTACYDKLKTPGVGGNVSAREPNYIITSGTCGDNATWALYGDHTLIVNGYGAMASYASAADTPWASYATQITKVVISGYITEIGAYDFAGCTALTTVDFASEFITKIDADAFENTAITELAVPTYIDNIASGAFDHLDTVYYEATESEVSGKSLAIVATTAYYTTQSGSCGDAAKWNIYDNGELVITGSGAIADYTSAAPAPWKTYLNDITKITIKDGIATIGQMAFHGLTNVTAVDMANTVKKIRGSAFNGETSLKDITLSQNLTTIMNYAFAKCSALTSITLPEKVTLVEQRVFNLCTGLTTVVLDEKLTSFGQYLFYSCTKLANVTLSSKTTDIAAYAFYGCSALTSIDVPATVKTFGANAFTNTNLTSFVIPATTTSIGANMLPTTVKNVTVNITADALTAALGSTTNKVLKGQVSGTTLVKAVVSGKESTGNNWILYDNGELVISGSSAMYSYSSSAGTGKTIPTWREDAYASQVTKVTVKSGVKSVGAWAFRLLANLETVTIESGATLINTGAFDACTSLTTVNLPVSVTNIANYAFRNCTALATINYGGNNTQWQALTIGTNNVPFTSAAVFYA